MFGLEAATLRVRERARLSVIGVGLAGARVARDERWRVALDVIAGTKVGRTAIAGLAVGPTVDFAELAHPAYGASAMAWLFVGLTPYARIGVRDDGSTYVDLGVQLSLPIARF